MYAVVEAGGRQWKVEPGTQFEINRITSDVGTAHTLERVLLASDGAQVQVGRPYLEGAKVVCEVVAHRLGVKTISYHFRRRENWRKTVGHRQPLTRLVVKDILIADAAVAAAAQPLPATKHEGQAGAEAAPKVRAPKTAAPSAEAPKARKTKAAATREPQKPQVKKEKGHGA